MLVQIEIYASILSASSPHLVNEQRKPRDSLAWANGKLTVNGSRSSNFCSYHDGAFCRVPYGVKSGVLED